ncbi:MAG: DUF3194 domain-containing protein [Candidatus Bathyarchaeia archaeon]
MKIEELTSEQIEELCMVAEEAARRYALSKVSSKKVETLNISVEAEGEKVLTLTVDVGIILSPLMKDFDVQSLVDGAVKEAFAAAEKHMRELKCRSPK